MKKQVLCLMVAAALAVTAKAQTTNTVDFTPDALAGFSGLTDVNAALAPYGFTVDAGYPDQLALDNDLTFATDPAAGDLVFNFSSPISLLTVNYDGNAGAATGLSAYSVSTTAADVFSLPGSDTLGYTPGNDNGTSLTVSSTSPIYSALIEDAGAIVNLQSITFVTEATPEPATLALFGMGALVVASRCRRAAK